MQEVLIDSILDTLKLAPVIIIVYVLIELAEHKFAGKFATGKVLFSPAAPLVGAAAGIIPQCGFSVVSANLYSAGKITLGTLLAVFIATSDEAIPVILSDYSAAPKLIPLILIKFAFAVLVGYIVHFAFRNGFKVRVKSKTAIEKEKTRPSEASDSVDNEKAFLACEDREVKSASPDKEKSVCSCGGKSFAMNTDSKTADKKNESAAQEEESAFGALSGEEKASGNEKGFVSAAHAVSCDRPDALHCRGCHGHSVTGGKEDFKALIVHPLLHSLTVLLYIFIVNLVLGAVLYYVGEEKLSDFLNKTAFLQPFLAALVGLIPNCAASVVISRLYALGSLSLGAAVAGLSAGAGIGYAVLFKENKNAVENFLIIGFMFTVCSLFGLIVDAVASLII